MPWYTAGKTSSRPTLSIFLVIAFQAVLGILLSLLAVNEIKTQYFSDQALPRGSASWSPPQFCSSSRHWPVQASQVVRWLSLILASTAVLAGGLGMLFYKRHVGFDFTPMLFEWLLIVSALVSVWWWVLFMRRRVRERFH